MQREVIDGLVQAFQAKDLEAALAFFTEDAEVYDPHYPVAEMRGKEAIRRGFSWAFSHMARPGFTIQRVYTEDGRGVVEVDTHHRFKNGLELKFSQLFLYEVQDGRIRRLQAYVPYPPPGMGSLLLAVTRWLWRLKDKLGRSSRQPGEVQA